MVQDNIRQDAQSRFVKGADGLQILVFGSVFGGDAALLVELAQIIQIINTVSHIGFARGTLICRGKPNIREAGIPQMPGILCSAFPVPGIFGEIPFKILQ